MPLCAPADVEATADGCLWIADTGADRIVYVDADGFTKVAGDLDAPVAVAVFSDGRTAYTIDRTGLHLVTLDAPGARLVFAFDSGSGLAVDEWQRVAYVSTTSEIIAVELDGGRSRVLVDDEVSTPRGLALSPDRRRLYVADPGLCGVSYFDLRSRSITELVRGLGTPTDVCITPAGIALADESGSTIYGVNARHATSTVIWDRELSGPRGISFDRVAKTILVADTGNDRIARIARDVSGVGTVRLTRND